MAITFTGLKLKGELGRFGKTEYSDIFGILPMPDEKVLSGCYWGNILVWDAGLITLEVFRSMRKTCHDGPIVQMFYEEEELWTVSMDGHIRVWWYEKIDQADPPDDDRVVLLDPSYDFYTPGTMLMSIEKRYPHDDGDRFFMDRLLWLQDGNGGIWLIDLNTEDEPRPSEQLYRCHAGEVRDIANCSFGPYFASLGEGGRLFIYNYLERKRLYEHCFPAKGTCLLWPSLEVVKTGDIILAGFDDGQVRVVLINLSEEENIKMTITQAIKPHNRPVTAMSVNPTGTILVTGGQDKTIFIFKLDIDEYSDDFLVPIGYIDSPDIVTCITWHFLKRCRGSGWLSTRAYDASGGPEDVQPYTGISFLLDLEPKMNLFKTYKAQIRRDIKIKEIQERKAKKIS
ncbi:hypothetical protein NQ317_012498 [Molorchus minor]|uniref:Uncharacterized protein n=1 Tax=Molorchus minor TaxID=1323400 RepID=A0ABQ9K2B6_9CUCU|nr:hypothetical protein NQ317_012498 [Molorchus minor]